MFKRLAASTVISLCAAMPASAQTYGETLLARALARHRDIGAITLTATGKAGQPLSVAAGTARKGQKVTSLPLVNAMGDTIGIVMITADRRTRPDAVVGELGRRIYVADNLTEADPFVAGARGAPAAQAIVERMIDSTPGLVTLAMHVTPNGSMTNIILASNFGRIGKPADDDDKRVIATGAVIRETTNGGKRLAVELPMRDRSGATIGALSTSFAITPQRGAEDAYSCAVALRNAIARRVASVAVLTQRPKQ